MPTRPGRDALLEVLEAEGVRYIFGNPGTTEGAIMHALEGHPDLEYILVAQEGVAMGMADGYARESGRPAFVNLHIETGLSNGLSLMCNAYAGGTPLVLTAANSSIGKVAEGRTDLVDLARPFSKWGAEVTNADQIPAVMRRAFREAKTPPTGPTFVSLAQNALDEMTDVRVAPSGDLSTAIVPDPKSIQAAAELLASAERPALLVGDRVAQYGAVEQMVRVAELAGDARLRGLVPNHDVPNHASAVDASAPALRWALSRSLRRDRRLAGGWRTRVSRLLRSRHRHPVRRRAPGSP